MHTARTRRAVAAGCTALTLSACGAIMPGEEFLEQSPHGMAKAALADMHDVTSMRILGDLDSDRYGHVRIDLRVGDAGCAGSVQTEDGGFQLRHNSDGTWFKADEKFVRSRVSPPALADELWKQVRGAWVARHGKDDFLKLCALDKLLSKFEVEQDHTEDTVDSDQVVEVGDAEVVPLTGQDGKERTTIWVAVDAPHHVLKMAPATDTGMPDALYFEEFGVDVVVETPRRKDVVVLPPSAI